MKSVTKGCCSFLAGALVCRLTAQSLPELAAQTQSLRFEAAEVAYGEATFAWLFDRQHQRNKT